MFLIVTSEGNNRALGIPCVFSEIHVSLRSAPSLEHSAHLAALSIGDRRSTESQVLAYSREWLLLSVIRSAVPRGGSSRRPSGGESCPVLPLPLAGSTGSAVLKESLLYPVRKWNEARGHTPFFQLGSAPCSTRRRQAARSPCTAAQGKE